MALADYAAYKSALLGPHESFHFQKNAAGNGFGNKLHTTWAQSPFAGAAPTTAVACSASTTGSLRNVNGNAQQNGSGALLKYLARASLNSSLAGTSTQYSMWLLDRLSHQGGLDATTPVDPTANTTNLPTAALTRYTSGVGVLPMLEIYETIGSTATTIVASYTNTAGTAGRKTLPTTFGGSGNNSWGRVLILPLQEGDIGCKSVESTTILASTGTAGNFGVTLAKPLAFYPCIGSSGMNHIYDSIIGCAGLIPVIDDGACLWLAYFQNNSSGGAMFSGVLDFIDT